MSARAQKGRIAEGASLAKAVHSLQPTGSRAFMRNRPLHFPHSSYQSVKRQTVGRAVCRT